MGQVLQSFLFGGALFAAGLSGAEASADEPLPFALSSYTGLVSYVLAGTYLWAGDQTQMSDFSRDLGAPFSSSNITAYVPGLAVAIADGYVDATAVSAITSTTNAAFGMKAYSVAYVEFTEPTDVRFEWDFPDFGLCSLTFPGEISPQAGVGFLPDGGAGSVTQLIPPGLYALRCYSWSESADAPAMARITLPSVPGCPCDMDGNELLNVDDVDAFVTAFLGGDLAADFDGNGSLNVDDVDAFVACFIVGCP